MDEIVKVRFAAETLAALKVEARRVGMPLSTLLRVLAMRHLEAQAAGGGA